MSKENELERVSSETMDEIRQEHLAYHYLCHLEEARNWIQCCIKEELPPTTELEENFRNGVYLAKLGHYISPKIVPLKKIYDIRQEYYEKKGLNFRHTDNINHWLKAMEDVGLPSYFLPDTFDVYDKKNMPKAVYCLHAISLYLYKLGRAPQIQDLCGKVHFSSEDIEAIGREFEKYGIQIPSFAKISGILASELAITDAALHASVFAINNAIDNGNAFYTLETLADQNVNLDGLVNENGQQYHKTLFDKKKEKGKIIQNKKDNEIPDIYDELLTRKEIQDCIYQVNEMLSVENVNEAIVNKNEVILQNSLPFLANEVDINPKNISVYMKFLSEAQEAKHSNNISNPLSKQEIIAAVVFANEDIIKKALLQNLITDLNQILEMKNEKALLSCLKDFPDQFNIEESASPLYMHEFSAIRKENKHNLSYEEIQDRIKIISAIVVLNEKLDKKPSDIWKVLSNCDIRIRDLNVKFANEYQSELCQIKSSKSLNDLPYISNSEIQECVNKVNKMASHKEEIYKINRAVIKNNTNKLIKALSSPEASILCVNTEQVQLYLYLLSYELKHKRQKHENCDVYLNQNEIQQIINKSQKIIVEANCICMTLTMINYAVDDERSDTLMEMLKELNVAQVDIIPQCSEMYLNKLKYLKQKKENLCRESGKDNVDLSWIVCFVSDLYHYYFNLKTYEYSWISPKLFDFTSFYLHQDDVQVTVDEVNAEHARKLLLLSSETTIIQLQAYCRGFLIRLWYANRKNLYQKNIDKIIKIQMWWRGQQCRKNYLAKKQCYFNNIKYIIKLQSYARMWLTRRRYLQKRELFLKQRKAAKKIQEYWKMYKMRKDFKLLLHSSNPPLSVVHKFVYLLKVSDDDYREELELQKARNKIIQTIRHNQKLEQEVNDMDLKIGMLIKNRITLQEIICQRKRSRTCKKDVSQLCEIAWLGNNKGLKAFSKESRNQLESYQHLIYTLQTEPSYLAKLLLVVPTNQASTFIESIILSLYSYNSTPREEYLLLCLFRRALKEEIQNKIDNVIDIITGNPLVIKLIVRFNRIGQGRNCLRDLLSPIIKHVMDDKMLHINTNPIEIYKLWISEIETETGERSSNPYVVTQNEALKHKEVKKRLDKAVCDLKEKTLLFFNTIINSLEKIPYGILYMAKVLKSTLKDKFPDIEGKEILKVVGNLIYYRYINSAIAAPDAFDIIDIGPNDALTIVQRRNLASIAKVLQFAASGKGFSTDSSHLLCLNPFLKWCHEKFKEFFRQACSVEEPEIHFKIDAYSEATLLTQPVVYLTIQELCDIHSLLLKYEDEIAPSPSDPLHKLLQELGTPTIQSLMGTNVGCLTGQTEICLTLSSKFLMTENDYSDIQQTYVKTKQMIIELLQYKNLKSTLSEMLNETPTTKEELIFSPNHHSNMMISSCSRNKSTVPKYSSLENLQKELVHNLYILELSDMVSKSNNYQTILDDISKDIRNRHYYRQCRKQELTKLENAQKKLDHKSVFCKEKLECYNQYIKRCLDNLSSGRKRVHIKDMFYKTNKQELKCRTCIKYTGAKLQEKGILLEVVGIDILQMKNITFEIAPTEDTGVFSICAKLLGVFVEKVEVDIQELLQLQYEGVTVMNMFDHAKVNVNLLLFLLNSKFYGKRM